MAPAKMQAMKDINVAFLFANPIMIM